MLIQMERCAVAWHIASAWAVMYLFSYLRCNDDITKRWCTMQMVQSLLRKQVDSSAIDWIFFFNSYLIKANTCSLIFNIRRALEEWRGSLFLNLNLIRPFQRILRNSFYLFLLNCRSRDLFCHQFEIHQSTIIHGSLR